MKIKLMDNENNAKLIKLEQTLLTCQGAELKLQRELRDLKAAHEIANRTRTAAEAKLSEVQVARARDGEEITKLNTALTKLEREAAGFKQEAEKLRMQLSGSSQATSDRETKVAAELRKVSADLQKEREARAELQEKLV